MTAQPTLRRGLPFGSGALRARLALFSAPLLVFAVAACGDSGDSGGGADDLPTTGPMAELIEAAQEEGSVVVYSSESDKQVADTSQAFEDEYGIEVQFTRLVSGTLTSRYAGEREGGTVVADVIVVSNDPLIVDNPQWFETLDDDFVPGYDDFPEYARDDIWVTMNHNVIGIAWNTDLVGPEDAPEGYLDLIENPAFEEPGSILYADPRATPSAMNLFKVLVETYGQDLFDELMARGVEIAPGSSPGVQQIAAGANKVLIGNFPNNANAVIAEGAPVEYVAVADPSTGVDNKLAVSSEAPHPNAARLYASWRMSQEGQGVMCEARGSTSPLGDLSGCEPPAPSNYISTDFEVYQDREWQAEHLPWLGLEPL